MIREARTRCLATMPLVAIAGAALGAGIAQESGIPMGSAALWFGAALSVTSYISAILETWTLVLLEQDAHGVAGDATALVWDLLLGGITGGLLAGLTSTSTLQAVAFVSAILFLQRFLVEKFLLGNLLGDSFYALIMGGAGHSAPEFSHAQALAVRGDLAGASLEFESVIAASPRKAAPYLAYARVLRDGGDFSACAAVLSRALASARLDARTSEAVTRELCELMVYRLDQPGRAAVVLARYIADGDGNGNGNGDGNREWARGMLLTAKEMATRDQVV